MRTKIVAFSGPCHSGKTTYAKYLKDKLGPDNVLIQDEIIRSYQFESIDTLRANPQAYFEVQKDIIKQKAQQEQEAAYNKRQWNHGDIRLIIFDRSLADSYYYLTNFVRYEKFDDELKREYFHFVDSVFEKALRSFAEIYDRVFVFSPIKIVEEDKMRPANLKEIQMFEYYQIELLNNGFAGMVNKQDIIRYINVKDDNSLYSFLSNVIA